MATSCYPLRGLFTPQVRMVPSRLRRKRGHTIASRCMHATQAEGTIALRPWWARGAHGGAKGPTSNAKVRCWTFDVGRWTFVPGSSSWQRTTISSPSRARWSWSPAAAAASAGRSPRASPSAVRRSSSPAASSRPWPPRPPRSPRPVGRPSAAWCATWPMPRPCSGWPRRPIAEFGHIDTLINVAGVNRRMPAEHTARPTTTSSSISTSRGRSCCRRPSAGTCSSAAAATRSTSSR